MIQNGSMNRIGKVLYRLLTYLPFKVGLACLWLASIPFIMIFNWNKIWQLLIAHEENCSIDEARNLMRTMPKYKFSRWDICFPNEKFSSTKFSALEASNVDTSHITSPSYYWRPGNIYHSNHSK